MASRPHSIAIVGGGFAGVATAYFLAQRGVRDIVVLEKEDACGQCASGRNAAMGRQLTEHDSFTSLAVRGAAFIRKPPRGFCAEPLWGTAGSVLLAAEQATLEGLAADADRWNLQHRLLSAAQVVHRSPILAGAPLVGGVEFPTDGVIDIHSLLQGFVAGARAAGVRVVTSCEVKSTVDRGSRRVVETSKGPFETKVVAVAAGAWAGDLGAVFGAHGGQFVARRRHLFMSEPLADLDRGAPFVWHVDRPFYLRPEGSGFLMSGCDQKDWPACNPSADPDACDDLARRFSQLVPGASNLGIARTWACLRTFSTRAQRPIVGWDDRVPWLYWIAGLGGHGATCSPAIGQDAAAELASSLAIGSC